ncbi:hypothetical protein HDU97_002297 [Phlyctochytrium planicorne]|nr:hypothetical protein HDU97_002297 [Phlyctochytrium planicorne]
MFPLLLALASCTIAAASSLKIAPDINPTCLAFLNEKLQPTDYTLGNKLRWSTALDVDTIYDAIGDIGGSLVAPNEAPISFMYGPAYGYNCTGKDMLAYFWHTAEGRVFDVEHGHFRGCYIHQEREKTWQEIWWKRLDLLVLRWKWTVLGALWLSFTCFMFIWLERRVGYEPIPDR